MHGAWLFSGAVGYEFGSGAPHGIDLVVGRISGFDKCVAWEEGEASTACVESAAQPAGLAGGVRWVTKLGGFSFTADVLATQDYGVQLGGAIAFGSL